MLHTTPTLTVRGPARLPYFGSEQKSLLPRAQSKTTCCQYLLRLNCHRIRI
jgi:hypothetical protein